MSFLESIILGIIQGITEFLPVSSSGHLELVKSIQGQDLAGESSMMMTVVLHFATALSTVFVFRKDILEILTGLSRFKMNDEFIFSVKIFLSMIPAVIVGVFFNDILESFFGGQIFLVGSMLILTGLILFLADRAKSTEREVSLSNSIVIGIAQAIAILPGISRSGATIATSVLLGVDKSKAARFSFLMVIPLILGKIIKDITSKEFGAILSGKIDVGISFGPVLCGFIAAFIIGIIACTSMISIVKKSKLSYFSYYCFFIGVIAIGYSIIN